MRMRLICVFCEGKTECNYIQALNRLLEESDIFDLRFTVKNLNGLKVNNYISKIKKYKPGDLKAFKEFYAWIDYDIFKTSGKSEKEVKDKIKKISFNAIKVSPLLNHMNGEDFIIMHENTNIIKKWAKVCKSKKHFKKPMASEVYVPMFKEIMPSYKKGGIMELNKEKVQRCVKNIDDSKVPFKSDIKKLLEIVLDYIG